MVKQSSTTAFRDIFIAATAIVNNLPVKTLNIKDFSRIPGLVLV
jgi:predicted nucleic acid-binding protein